MSASTVLEWLTSTKPLVVCPNHFWRMDDVDAVNTAHSYEKLIETAFTVARRMPANQPRVFVSGPNIAEIYKGIDLLESKGFNVFNQLPFYGAIVRINARPEDVFCPFLQHEEIVHSLVQLPGWRETEASQKEWEVFVSSISTRQRSRELIHLSVFELPGDWKKNLTQPSRPCSAPD